MCVFFVKQKTAYEMRISDWSSDVCSSDLLDADEQLDAVASVEALEDRPDLFAKDVLALVDVGRVHCSVEDANDHGARLSRRRSEERRVGTEGVSTCRSRCSRYH